MTKWFGTQTVPSGQFWNICDLLCQQTLHSVRGPDLRGVQELNVPKHTAGSLFSNGKSFLLQLPQTADTKRSSNSHWGLPPAPPNNSHNWSPPTCSLSSSFLNPDLYQAVKKHLVLGQHLLICPSKKAADQVGESSFLPEPCQLTSCSKVNWIKKAQSCCTIWFSSFKFTLK